MTADDVAALPEEPDSLFIEKGALSNQLGRNQEVRAPSSLAQLFVHIQGAFSAIVERQQQMRRRPAEIDVRDQFRPPAVCRNRIEMIAKRGGRMLVPHRQRALETGLEYVVRYLMVPEACGFQHRSKDPKRVSS